MNVRELIDELEKLDDDQLDVIASGFEAPDHEIIGVEPYADEETDERMVILNLGREV